MDAQNPSVPEVTSEDISEVTDQPIAELTSSEIEAQTTGTTVEQVEGGTDESEGGQEPEPEQEPEVFEPEEGANVILSKDGRALSEGPVVVGLGPAILIPSEGQQRAGFKVDKKDAPRLINQYRQFKYYVADKKAPGQNQPGR